jgi:SAM-dependent methyltransferase
MSHVTQYTQCPVCKKESFKEVLQAQDFSVSGETFPVVECSNCSLRFTQDVPCQTGIQRYYKSADYISHSNTKKGLINFLYHVARRFTMMSKKNLVRTATKRSVGMLLDVGSGIGTFVHTMEKAGWNAVGLEPDEQARSKSAKLYNVDIYPSSELATLPYGTYDAITLWHVLEHVHTLDEYIEQLKLLLAPGGKLIIAVPNYTSKDAAAYKQYWAAYDVPRHLYHFSPASVRTLMANHGMKVIGTKPMWFDSFYISLLSEKYRGGNMLKAIWNGIISNLNVINNREQCSSQVYIIEKQ